MAITEAETNQGNSVALTQAEKPGETTPTYTPPEKNKGGRPLKFATPEELEEKVQAYFDTTPWEEWTITGLAIALDTSRETLQDYGKKERFSDTIKKARTFVEHAYERRLIKRGNGGDVFALKNFGWKDEKSLNHGGTVGFHLSSLFDKAQQITQSSVEVIEGEVIDN